MKSIHIKFVSVFFLLSITLSLLAQSGIYVGGHFRRDRTVTVPTLKASGFTYVILFNIQVESNGDLTTDGETICKNGEYVFATTQPNYVKDVMSLRQGMTSIRRVETCIGGWGSISYDNIKTLINSQGTGATSILYKNFKALKDKIPVIEAINNDDEHTYDVATAAAFHVMLYDIGFKTTLAPYMNKNFWQNLATSINNSRPGAVDRIDIQCYDGGAGNNPKDWNINNIKLHSGLLHFNTTSTITSKMQEWKNNSTTTGGFLWVYNDNDFNLKNYAASITTVFGGGDIANVDKLKPHITVYSEKNYQGKAVNFEMGKYLKVGIQAQEFPDLSLNSVRLSPGFLIDLYETSNYTGSYVTINSSTPDIKSIHAGNVNSWVVKTDGDVTLANKRMYIKNRKSGLYMTLATTSTTNGVLAQQKSFSGADNQKWVFSHAGGGVYRINNKLTNKTLQALNAGEADSTSFIQGAYAAALHQLFLIYKSNTEGFYKLIPLHSLKPLSVTSDLSDSNIAQTTDQTVFESDWQLIDETASGVDVIKNNLINIYPNPAKDFIIISADDNNIEKVEITDLLGRLVFTDKSGATRLNLNDLKSGQYICRVWLSNQPIPKVARIIK
mgnify:CR=1 FL=1